LKAFIFILIISFFTSCKYFSSSDNSEEKVIAEVGNKKLFLSEVESLINYADKEDSLRILKGLINNWAQDQLMIQEAERNMPKDVNLDKLVLDYRQSLLLYNYETQISGELLDTVITAEQRQKYYDEHAAEFELSEPIAKFIFVKFPSKTSNLDKFYKTWKEEDIPEESISNVNKYGEYSDMDYKKWKPISQLESYLPKNLVSRSTLDDEASIRKKEKDYEYFIKVLDYYDQGDKPPFDYIQSKIEKVLLNERKKELIKDKKAQLYNKRANEVKIYVK
jgi:hypothetical protein